MSQKTEPLFKFILCFCLLGLVLIVWSLVTGGRDVLALSGAILIATCISAIAKLVK